MAPGEHVAGECVGERLLPDREAKYQVVREGGVSCPHAMLNGWLDSAEGK